MNTRYDVAILGCGEAGIFAGYELMHRSPGLKVVTLDQGADIYTRSCPIVAGKVKECIHCKVCDTMCGFGGAGAFSDGKYNFTTAFGGWLTDFMPKKEVMELIDYVDSINMKHGATDQVYSTETPEARALEKKALEYDLHLLQARCKHLGTENNLKILQSIYEECRKGVEFRFHTPVTRIENLNGEGYFVCYNETYYPDPRSHPVPGDRIDPARHLRLLKKTGLAKVYVISNNSPAVILYRAPEGFDLEGYLADDGQSLIVRGSLSYTRIPWEWLIDGVEVFDATGTTNAKRLRSDIDAGAVTFVGLPLGRTLHRRLDEQASEAAGYAIYQDTNNSSDDFYERATQSLRDEP